MTQDAQQRHMFHANFQKNLVAGWLTHTPLGGGRVGVAFFLPVPSAAMAPTASAINGFQLRMPTYTGKLSSRASSSACFSVSSVSGERPIKL